MGCGASVCSDEGYQPLQQNGHEKQRINVKPHHEPDILDKQRLKQMKIDNARRRRLIKYVSSNIIGKDKTFLGPYGVRKVLYLDYTASGRALKFVEDYIRNEVLPNYANTHTTTSVTSVQTTLFRKNARNIVRSAVNATEKDCVIFTGSGSTGAIHKLVHALDLKQPPVVFIGPYEHHSNILPWRECGAKVIRIKMTPAGLVDVAHLEQELRAWLNSKRMLIGSFSAASNVTGTLVDMDVITTCLHKYNALAFWDYSTAAPYVQINMNPEQTKEGRSSAFKDAIFFSPHKFIGGVNTPGVLVAKKKLFVNKIPHNCGGGTVFYVSQESHRYLQDLEEREEGGTPDIVGSIRVGLVFQLKNAIGPEIILAREEELFEKAKLKWQNVKNLVILGSLEVPRLPIFSFLNYHPESGLFLHHNFTSTLLNDLFGIQSRGGCACAGPYAMDLLGINEDDAMRIKSLLADESVQDAKVQTSHCSDYTSREIFRPGFVRLNLPFIMTDEELDFVLEAVKLVAEDGWRLLPQYTFIPTSGVWRHKDMQVYPGQKLLEHISYNDSNMHYSLPQSVNKGSPASFKSCLKRARQLIDKTKSLTCSCWQSEESSTSQQNDDMMLIDEAARPFCWFLLPSKARAILHDHSHSTDRVLSHKEMPFCPPSLSAKIESEFQQIPNSDLKLLKKANGFFQSGMKDLKISKENFGSLISITD